MVASDHIIKLIRTGFCAETAGFSTNPPRLMPLLVLLLALYGCAQTPAIYTMQPSALETIRAEISTIGVYLSPERPQTEVLLPAKGVWGGLKRGIVVGASLPVMIGFVSPVPGGTFLGLLVSPFGALIGGVYGIFTAVPAEEVEHAEVILAIATEKIRQRGLSDRFIENIIDLGHARTQLSFVALPPAPSSSPANPSHPPMDAVDARLQIQVQKTGLHGMYRIDPPPIRLCRFMCSLSVYGTIRFCLMSSLPVPAMRKKRSRTGRISPELT
jgi:hypothetical protein